MAAGHKVYRIYGKTFHIKREGRLAGGTRSNPTMVMGNSVYRATKGGEHFVFFVFHTEMGWVTSDRSPYGFLNMKDAIRDLGGVS